MRIEKLRFAMFEISSINWSKNMFETKRMEIVH